jgi:short-subunit dehydrogenase
LWHKSARSLQDIWQIEQFDFLVNNAGIGIFKPFTTVKDEFDQLVNKTVQF